jgi:uncharacterized DUF497 family protein
MTFQEKLIWIKCPLIWSQAVVDKIWVKHRVSPEEVDEAVSGDKLFCRKSRGSSYLLLGRAVNGRYLFIVLKKRGKESRYKVVTAREMQLKEKRYYKKETKQC